MVCAYRVVKSLPSVVSVFFTSEFIITLGETTTLLTTSSEIFLAIISSFSTAFSSEIKVGLKLYSKSSIDS